MSGQRWRPETTVEQDTSAQGCSQRWALHGAFSWHVGLRCLGAQAGAAAIRGGVPVPAGADGRHDRGGKRTEHARGPVHHAAQPADDPAGKTAQPADCDGHLPAALDATRRPDLRLGGRESGRTVGDVLDVAGDMRAGGDARSGVLNVLPHDARGVVHDVCILAGRDGLLRADQSVRHF